MFKYFTIGKKLGFGFGVVLVLMIGIVVYNYSGLLGIGEQTHLAQKACNNRAFAIEKEVDHLMWMASLSNLFIKDDVTEVTVQKDDHECGLGKWMFSEETMLMAQEDPELAAIIDKIKEPHYHLHETAVKIDQRYEVFDLELESLLAHRWIDHLNWIKNVANSNLNHSEFDGGLDPHNCAFGKWYYTYDSENPELNRLLKQWEEPHADLHKSAQTMVAAQQAGNWKEAARIYHYETLPLHANLEAEYNKTLDWIENQASNQKAALEIFDTETMAAVSEVQGYLKELKEYFDQESSTATTQTNSLIDSLQTIILILSFVALLLGIGAAYFIARSITRPVSDIANIAESISSGDIDQEIKYDSLDEIGVLAKSFRNLIQYMKNLAGVSERIAANDLTVEINPESDKDVLGISFKTMTENLTTMVRQIGDNATQLVSAASEVASTSEQMSRGANEQAQQVTQVSAAVEEMSATVVESAQNAESANENARNASSTAESGGKIVHDTMEGMQRITDVVSRSASNISKLAESADQIGEIISVIDDIADQTNLLALNAAIEAARAGEQGRGFAVVADEVRKLAERTGKATGEITVMIKGIQAGTQDAVSSMESGIQEVDKGRELTDKAGSTLSQIVGQSQSVQDMIQQLATASSQQSAATEQIAKNIELVSSITKETATGAEQSAAAAEELSRQAESMQGTVSQFKVLT